MTSFDALWDESSVFRGLFIGKGRPFSSDKTFDRDAAMALWEARFPRVDWCTCEYKGCTELVKRGQYCSDHCHVNGELPLYAWVKKTLYRYIAFQRGAQKTINDREYRKYADWAATKKFKKVPNGYRVFLKDRNPFNCHADNLLLLSKYSYYLVEKKLISLEDAMEIDMRIGNLLHERMRAGRRPFFAVFGYSDISNVSGANMTCIWKEIERGNLNPSDLSSIVEFVNKHKNRDNEGMNGEA